MTVTTLDTMTAKKPRSRSSRPTGMISPCLCGCTLTRAGLIISATMTLAMAATSPMANKMCVGGSAAAPPSQPTTNGPSPCPTEAATM